MSKEKYQPSTEEMKKAEETMTEEQKRDSGYREINEQWRNEIMTALKRDPSLIVDLINDLQSDHYANFRFQKYQKSMGKVPKSQKDVTEAWFNDFVRRLRDHDTKGMNVFTTQNLVREVKPDSMERMISALNLDTVYLTSHVTHTDTEGSTEHLRLWKNPPNSQRGYPDWGTSGQSGIMETWGLEHEGAIHDSYLEAERMIRHITEGPDAAYKLDKEDFFRISPGDVAVFRQKGYKQYKLIKK
ncbi:MAG: hypothetical protein Q7N87_04635 [Candidatus Uhrbacteria bacterium]|nr:hypothetical protein [Candidatus Uhrbacteria bacterium]